ncbi:MAG: succinate dehydrogenase assembly factor 2 [Burkholderiales bacterium]|nr:succinate dehydrogenase assembly factor 2 [Burkholderiales bacterium]
MGEYDRLRWRCRRGLLELDLILQDFLERRYAELDAEHRGLFGELLDAPDNDLLDWALGRSEPTDARFRDIVRLLRAG